MRDDLERLLDDVTLVTLALAIAVGWSLYNLARGIALFIEGLLTRVPADEANPYQGLTWLVGRHVIELDAIVYGAVELAVTLGVALWVVRRAR